MDHQSLPGECSECPDRSNPHFDSAGFRITLGIGAVSDQSASSGDGWLVFSHDCVKQPLLTLKDENARP